MSINEDPTTEGGAAVLNLWTTVDRCRIGTFLIDLQSAQLEPLDEARSLVPSHVMSLQTKFELNGVSKSSPIMAILRSDRGTLIPNEINYNLRISLLSGQHRVRALLDLMASRTVSSSEDELDPSWCCELFYESEPYSLR
jgi:hypothetical protein